MRIHGVLLDKDGTLISFEKTWGPAMGAVVFALAGGDPAKIAAQSEALHFSFESLRFLPTSPIIAGSSGHFGQVWAHALGRTDYAQLKAEVDALTAVESLKSLTPIGEPLAVIDKLRWLGLRVGVATNDSESSARRQLAALRLTDRLDFIAGYDSGHGSKPEPGMVLAFASHLGVDSAEVAMVGDTPHDLKAARAAGSVAIAVLTGPAPRDALEPYADHILDSISDLPCFMSQFLV